MCREEARLSRYVGYYSVGEQSNFHNYTQLSLSNLPGTSAKVALQ